MKKRLFLALVVLQGEAALANHLTGCFQDDRSQSESVLFVPLQLAIKPLPDFLVAKGMLAGIHDLRILEDFAK